VEYLWPELYLTKPWEFSKKPIVLPQKPVKSHKRWLCQKSLSFLVELWTHSDAFRNLQNPLGALETSLFFQSRKTNGKLLKHCLTKYFLFLLLNSFAFKEFDYLGTYVSNEDCKKRRQYPAEVLINSEINMVTAVTAPRKMIDRSYRMLSWLQITTAIIETYNTFIHRFYY
jgi:hypothetical protein